MLSPEEIWGELFVDIQMSNIFPDSKTFVDCIPKFDSETILEKYSVLKNELPESSKLSGSWQIYDLKGFILDNFKLPETTTTVFETNQAQSVEEHIKNLWPILLREADTESLVKICNLDQNSSGFIIQGSSLIPLPHSYIVPGGRFGEVYYWDSYFTMLGLAVHQKWEVIENMIDNFAHLINTIGHIPNGNRTYYKTRSQPPFFALMVSILEEKKGENVWDKYKDSILKECNFWMSDSEQLTDQNQASRRVVKVGDYVVNRYWDDSATPRPESYREDVETAHESTQPAEIVYRNLRAGAESGWDFSSRWFKDSKNISTIYTTDIIPVDLNCLLYFYESRLDSKPYRFLKPIRFEFIRQKCWNEEENFFCDFDFKLNKTTDVISLAGIFPLFFQIATEYQAKKVAERIEKDFLKDGGLITSLHTTGQQWDSPNGWAPLQWIAYKGLKNYGFDELADEIKSRWLNLNKKVFEATGKMMEKYNVCDTELLGGGGEYPNQDGFGWTNGVYLKMLNEK